MLPGHRSQSELGNQTISRALQVEEVPVNRLIASVPQRLPLLLPRWAGA